MAAATILVYDVAAVDGGARRPTLGDIGGGILLDLEGFEPAHDGTELYDDMLNQMQKLGSAHGRVACSAKLTILATGAARSVLKSQYAGTLVVDGDFTIVRDSAGVTRIQWTSTKLPAPTCWPEVTTHGATGSIHGGSCVLDLNLAGAGAGVATPGTHRIMVTTHTAGAVADISFTISFN